MASTGMILRLGGPLEGAAHQAQAACHFRRRLGGCPVSSVVARALSASGGCGGGAAASCCHSAARAPSVKKRASRSARSQPRPGAVGTADGRGAAAAAVPSPLAGPGPDPELARALR